VPAKPSSQNVSKTEYVDRRIDRYVNECRRRFRLTLSTAGIEAAPVKVLKEFLNMVIALCDDAETSARLNSILKLETTDLPPNSGRRRLQRVVQRLDG